MIRKNILLLCGGKSSEHEISLRSSNYIEQALSNYPDLNVVKVVIDKENGIWLGPDGTPSFLDNSRKINGQEIHFAIPCIHGYPGETGDIQIFFEMIDLPYLGCTPETSRYCFNKITTKLWLSALGIPNTPYIFLNSPQEEYTLAFQKLNEWKSVFIKASSQGSSVGCYHAKTTKELKQHIQDAFHYSPWVLIEKAIAGRELEVATYEYEGQIIATKPGEIRCPSQFYTYEEKYHAQSKTLTYVEALDLTAPQIETMQNLALQAYHGLKIRHLSRMDFFLSNEGELLLNEINTFPGLTSISMFPKMMENHGHSFKEYLYSLITKLLT